jgi:hypothetical protein
MENMLLIYIYKDTKLILKSPRRGLVSKSINIIMSMETQLRW